eukprot:172742_1
MGADIECEHNLKIKYFNSMYDKLKNKFDSLNEDETHIDFIVNDNIHNDCCNFLRCNEFGNIIFNIPKPIISYIQILGNDIIRMELIPNKQIILNNFNIISYDISYCYNNDTINEKQDKIQWETIQIDYYKHNNPYLLEFEIDDLNLINVDLQIKIRYLLSNKQGIQLWTIYSAPYKLTQCDLYKSMSNIGPCIDDDLISISTNDNDNDDNDKNIMNSMSGLCSLNPQHSLNPQCNDS